MNTTPSILKGLPADWQSILADFFISEAGQGLSVFWKRLVTTPHFYPAQRDVFKAFEMTSCDDVRVVILGQDPYHGPSQAHGLSFSVPQGVKVPPSLKNVYKDLERSLDIQPVQHGCLEPWSEQGVFLLNSVMTVLQGQAGSHRKKGWEAFTDEVIRQISLHNECTVFMLWGSYAASKEALIDHEKHLILKTSHPSPLSAYRGFLGSNHFALTNAYLIAKGFKPIEWQLPS